MESAVPRLDIHGQGDLVVDLDGGLYGSLHGENLGLVHDDVQRRVGELGVDVELFVERRIVAQRKVLDLGLALGVLVLPLVDKQLGQQERVGDVVVRECLGEGVLSEGAEQEELQRTRQGVERGVGGCKERRERGPLELGVTRLRRVSVVVVVSVLLAVKTVCRLGERREEVGRDVQVVEE